MIDFFKRYWGGSSFTDGCGKCSEFFGITLLRPGPGFLHFGKMISPEFFKIFEMKKLSVLLNFQTFLWNGRISVREIVDRRHAAVFHFQNNGRRISQTG